MRVLRRSGDAYVRYKRERLFPAPCVSQVFFPPPQHPPLPADNAENPSVNPCHDNTHSCEATARCQPGAGMEYTCECAAGYRTDGRGCRGEWGLRVGARGWW